MQNVHPALSVRPFLTGIDSSISDSQLQLVYNVFSTTFSACPVDVAYTLIFQQIRTLYIELLQAAQVEHAKLWQTAQFEQAQLLQTAQLEHAKLQITVQALVQQLEQQRVQYEARLAESRADRAEAIAHDKQNTMVLHNHLLRTPRLAAPALKGSASRAETWRSATKEHPFQRRKLPTTPATVDAMRSLVEPKVEMMKRKRYGNETQMYPDILDIFSEALPELASFHDTSNTPFLAGQKPDITLASPEAIKPEPDLVRAVIEVKKPAGKRLETGQTDAKTLSTDKDLGQVFDYLVAMIFEQPGRRIFTGILSSVVHNIVVSIEIGENGWTIVQHNITNIYETLAYLYETALVELAHLPPTPGFVYGGNMRRRLGNPRHCLVGEFAVRGCPGLVMAIKRYDNPASEISYLRAFRDDKSRPPSIPMLLYTADDDSEFGIAPVGAPLIPGVFANQVQAQTILTDVLEALVWLHSLGIVHRDVRCENVVITPGGHGVLIDFDAACDFRRGSARPWRGGYICCPPWHVRRLIAGQSAWSPTNDGEANWSTTTYSPGPSDDWHAWLLLANCLMFPNAFAGFQSHLVGTRSTESRRLLALWESLERSVVWAPFVAAACESDVTFLRQLPSIFTWL